MTKMITVIHLRDSPLIGGVEISLLNWFKNFKANDIDYKLLVFEEQNEAHIPFIQLLSQNNIHTEIVPWGKKKQIFKAIKYLSNVIKKYPNSIIHTHDARSDIVGIIAAKLCKVPAISHNHAWHGILFKVKVIERIRTWVMPYFNLLLSVSKDTENESILRGLPKDKCRTVYTGIDLSDFSEDVDRKKILSHFSYTDEHFIIGNLARLSIEKNQSLLIEMMHQLSNKYPKLRLFIAGEGEQRKILKSLVNQYKLEDVVKIENFQHDLQGTLAMFNLFCLPSLAEGTPIVLYNAMAMKIPIVTSDVSGCSEILQHKKTGLLYNFDSPGDFIEQVEKIICQPEMQKTLANNAFHDVNERFSINKSCEKLNEIYREFY